MNPSSLSCIRNALVVFLVTQKLCHIHGFTATSFPSTKTLTKLSSPNEMTQLYASARENEIRRKIMKLKKKGKLKSDSSSSTTSSPVPTSIDDYADKIASKLGKGKSKLLTKLNPELGEAIMASDATSSSSTSTLNEEEEDNTYDETEEDEQMLAAVYQKMALLEKEAANSGIKTIESGNDNSKSLLGPTIEDMAKNMEKEMEAKMKEIESQQQQQGEDEQLQGEQTTAGIGGKWNKDATSEVDYHRPVNGGWGYFPRPKDISKAYGGGKKLSRESTYEDEVRKQQSVEDTKDKLRSYREKAGIEVPSEKEFAKEIEEALNLGQLAMQRGVYSTAVSALEKVTKYCGSNSKVGSKVFLELAMAYEAVGRTSEAIQIYTTLSTCRMEDVKFNAKKLLYGIESMKFMREEIKSEAFSRKRSTETFIDTTGLGNIAANFDEKVYNTAYIDLDKGGGFYRKLTESVVRSVREARQILLLATDSGEVDRPKIIQALKSIDRRFNEALKEKIEREQAENSVVMINGKPIVANIESKSSAAGMESFTIGDINQTKENMNGEWRLQLMADSKGDGVNFFNKTLSWQNLDSDKMSYDASGPAGFLSVTQSGYFEIDEQLRIITRRDVKSSGSGAFFTDLYSPKLSGAMAATNLPQQIVSIDSELLLTRAYLKKKPTLDTFKGYYCVWRRAENGAYSKKKQ